MPLEPVTGSREGNSMEILAALIIAVVVLGSLDLVAPPPESGRGDAIGDAHRR